MATSIVKRLIGTEDVAFDEDGTDTRMAVPTSTGSTRSVKRVNAKDIPLSAATREQKTAEDAKFTATDVDAAIAELGAELEQIGIPDGLRIEELAGTLQIKADSIRENEMADNSIDSDQYVNGSIDNEHLAVGAIAGSGTGTNVVLAKSIDTPDIADGAIEALQILDGTISAEKLATDSVKGVSLDMDTSGTGFSHFIFLAGTHNYGGGGGTSAISVAGIADTDTVLLTYQTRANNIAGSGYELKVVADNSSGTAIITFLTDPGVSIINFLVLRAVTT
jgi:hypothetical protein